MADKKEKKEDKEIPDELPSLAEDILKEDPEGDDKPAAAEEEVPDELPSLDADLPDEPAEEATVEAAAPQVEAKPEPEVKAVAKEPEAVTEPDDPDSYFGHLIDRMKKNPHLSGDFLTEMKSYWKGHGSEEEDKIREGLKTSFELDLEKEMQEKVKQLKQLEALWKKEKLELERSKKLVENTEIEISLRSEELKKVLDTLTELREVYKDIRHKIKTRKPSHSRHAKRPVKSAKRH